MSGIPDSKQTTKHARYMPDSDTSQQPFLGQDLRGLRFGRLAPFRFSHVRKTPNGSRKYYWDCKCDCGNEVTVEASSLKHGRIISCKCAVKDMLSLRNTKHGMSKRGTSHPFYNCWRNMLSRCEYKGSIVWDYYGGRGIKVCARWHVFLNFYKDMFPTWRPGLEINRINNDGNYCKSNCEWTTRSENMYNTRRVKRLTSKGATRPMSKWGFALGGGRSMVRCRLESGWSIQKALTTPKLK